MSIYFERSSCYWVHWREIAPYFEAHSIYLLPHFKWPSRCRPKILLLLRYYDAGQYCTRTMCWHSESGLIKNITMQFSWHLWKLGFTYGIAFVSQFVFVYECGIWCLCFVQGTVFVLVFVCGIWVSQEILIHRGRTKQVNWPTWRDSCAQIMFHFVIAHRGLEWTPGWTETTNKPSEVEVYLGRTGTGTHRLISNYNPCIYVATRQLKSG